MDPELVVSRVQPAHAELDTRVRALLKAGHARYANPSLSRVLCICGIGRELVAGLLNPHTYEEFSGPTVYVWLHGDQKIAELQAVMVEALQHHLDKGALSFWLFQNREDALVPTE